MVIIHRIIEFKFGEQHPESLSIQSLFVEIIVEY
jgi:hypothetical protein